MAAPIVYTEPLVDHSEVTLGFNSPIEAIGEEGLTATRILRCKWEDRLMLADQLRVAHRITLTNGPGLRTFFRGDKYPHDPNIFVSNIPTIRPIDEPTSGVSSRVAKYTNAHITVNYKIFDFDSSENNEDNIKYADEELSTAAEFLTLPSRNLFWDNAQAEPLGEEANVSRLIRMMEWVFAFTELDTLPQGLLDNSGTVNIASVTSRSLGLTFPAETLLYNGTRSSRELFIDGARAWRASLRFTYRPQGWNKFFRDDEPAQAPVSIFNDAGTLHKPYFPINFQSALGV